MSLMWVTGASSGLGEAFSLEAARAGYTVAITARRPERLNEVAARAVDWPGQLHPYAGDITDAEQMKHLLAKIEQNLGPIHRLVANAGTHLPTDVTNFDVEEYIKIMNVNFIGQLNCLQAAIPPMLKRKKGHLVGVSSVAAYRGLPRAAAYGASKAALSHFLESIRFDLESSGIKVSVVSPGFVRTPLTDKNEFPMPCLMEPNDAASAMLRGIEREQMEVHFPKRFTYAMKFFRLLPQPIYHSLVRKYIVS